MKEANVSLVGGHSVMDPELKYGLSVTGIVHPDRVLTNRGAHNEDVLVLTKPIGTGIINTAIKAGMATEELIHRVTYQMAQLNHQAASVMADFSVHACTDVTGFGLLGHLVEMIDDARISVKIHWDALPHIEESVEFSNMGLVPAGLHRNRKHFADSLQTVGKIPTHIIDLVCDPQTSGGLLIAVAKSDGDELVKQLQNKNIDAAIVAQITDDPSEKVIIG